MQGVRLKKTRCNFCLSHNSQVYWKDVTIWEFSGKFTYVKCLNCGLIYLNPRPRPHDIFKFYDSDAYWGEDINLVKKQAKLVKKPIYEKVVKYKKRGKILDIGTGTGSYLDMFDRRKWQIYGTDLIPRAARLAKKHFGIDVKVGDFLKIKFRPNTFDVVVLDNVLEHTFTPLETLKKVYKVMKVDALLVVSVPNLESFGAKIFGKDWSTVQPARHLYHFPLSVLKKELEKIGFKVLDVSYNYSAHNYYHLYESFRYKFSPKFKKGDCGGLLDNTTKEIDRGVCQRMIKEIGKIICFVFAKSLSLIEPYVGKGEVYIIYAKKT